MSIEAQTNTVAMNAMTSWTMNVDNSEGLLLLIVKSSRDSVSNDLLLRVDEAGHATP